MIAFIQFDDNFFSLYAGERTTYKRGPGELSPYKCIERCNHAMSVFNIRNGASALFAAALLVASQSVLASVDEDVTKDPIAIAGCQERAAEDKTPAEGLSAAVQDCLNELADELPLGDDGMKAQAPSSNSTRTN